MLTDEMVERGSAALYKSIKGYPIGFDPDDVATDIFLDHSRACLSAALEAEPAPPYPTYEQFFYELTTFMGIPPRPGTPRHVWDTEIFPMLKAALGARLDALPANHSLLHAYIPHRKYPWFCGHCGYPEHERLQHPAQGIN